MNKDYKRLTKRNYFEGDYSVVPEELSKEITRWKEQHATQESSHRHYQDLEALGY